MAITGTIILSTITAAALWTQEFTGQFSDGMWENSRPYDHWKFWCNLEVKVGTENKVITDRPYECKKTAYNLASLIPIVGERMLKIGRMAKASGDIVIGRSACEYMPATIEEWTSMKESGKWQYDFIAKYMEVVTPELAKAFYETVYTMKDMRADIKVIKEAMKTMKQ